VAAFLVAGIVAPVQEQREPADGRDLGAVALGGWAAVIFNASRKLA